MSEANTPLANVRDPDPDRQARIAAASVYERRFVPAEFQEWAPRTLDAAGVGRGHRVLDVACGTGVVAREAARRVGAAGLVAGRSITNRTD